MNYRGTIGYRAGVGGMVTEGFCASLVAAWDFLYGNFSTWRLPDPVTSELVDLVQSPKIHFMRGLSCMLHDSANQIAEGFLGEWAMFLDTDHVFSSDALFELITTFEDKELSILTGFAQKRRPPYTPLIYKTDFNPLVGFEPIILKGLERHTLMPIDSGGLACLMVRRKVFDDIKAHGEKPFDMRPKFDVPHLFTGKLLNTPSVALPVDRHRHETFWEDVSFYWRAKMLGYQAWCAPWIKFHHLETRLVDESLINAPAPKDPRIPV